MRALLSPDERKKIKEGATLHPQTYKVGDATFDEVTDMSGDSVFLKERFDKDIKNNDYILFFFNVNDYLTNNSYKKDVDARIDFIHQHFEFYTTYYPSISIRTKKVLLVGTHIDDAKNKMYEVEIAKSVAGKPYAKLFEHIVYINMLEEGSYKRITDKLKTF